MTDLRQAAQQALKALEELDGLDTETECVTIDVGDVITALRTALEQQQAEPPPEWLLIKNILDEYGLQAIDFVAEFKAAQQVATIWKQAKPFSPEAINTTQTAWRMGYEAAKAEQQAEPVCPECKAAVLYECVACSSNNYPPQQQAEPPPEWPLIKNILAVFGLDAISFVAKWQAAQQQAEPVVWGVDWGHNGDRSCVAIIKKHHNGTMEVIATEYDTKASAPPQRQWVGLTDEDFLEACQLAERGNYLVAFQRIQIKLKERNT